MTRQIEWLTWLSIGHCCLKEDRRLKATDEDEEQVYESKTNNDSNMALQYNKHISPINCQVHPSM